MSGRPINRTLRAAFCFADRSPIQWVLHSMSLDPNSEAVARQPTDIDRLAL